MHPNSRRQFLRQLTFTCGSLSLAACGGGQQAAAASDSTSSGSSLSGGGTVSAPIVGAPPPPPPPPPAPAPAPTPAPAPGPAPAPAPLPAVIHPAWIQGQPLNTWFAIPATMHAGSAAAPGDSPQDPYASSNRRLSYSGMGLRNSEIVLAANGGHSDYSGNEVTSLDLSQDAPAWALRSAASSAAASNVAYYADGKPSSRHTYWSTIWSEQHNRLMLHYSRFVYGTGVSFTNSNGFNLDANTWDPQDTWGNGFSAGCADASGNCYAMGTGYFSLDKWTAATGVWSTVATFDDAINVNPVCYDSQRGHLFALAWGDGQGNALSGPASLSAIRIAGATKTSITFKPGAALTQFQSDAPIYSAMEYDPVNDQYLFYEGAAGRTGRIYAVKPNDSAVWDLSILALGAGSVLPDAAVGAGVFNRFKYVPALRGFVLMSSGTSNVYFLRTA